METLEIFFMIYFNSVRLTSCQNFSFTAGTKLKTFLPNCKSENFIPIQSFSFGLFPSKLFNHL